MATWEARPIILTIFLSVLVCQVSALGLPLRLILEPFLIDLRIRAASVFNRAGLGLGGLLTTIGEAFHSILDKIGKKIQGRLNEFSKNFNVEDFKTDTETDMFKELQEIRKSQLDEMGFPKNLPEITRANENADNDEDDN